MSHKDVVEFFRVDHPSTLFPLQTSLFVIERLNSDALPDIESQDWQVQIRANAAKSGHHIRSTLVLDPVAAMVLYTVVHRNRKRFRNSGISLGYTFVDGRPVPVSASYSQFKGRIAAMGRESRFTLAFDVAEYFNSIYHHDLVHWLERASFDAEDAQRLGKLFRQINSGTSIGFLPQGLYPSKMIGSGFLNDVDFAMRRRSASAVRFMDDYMFFDNDNDVLLDDFYEAQALLSKKGLSVNPAKTEIGDGEFARMSTSFGRRPIRKVSTAGDVDTSDDDDDDDDGEDLGDDDAFDDDWDGSGWSGNGPGLGGFPLRWGWDGFFASLDAGKIREPLLEDALTRRKPPVEIIDHLPQVLAGYPSLTKQLVRVLEGLSDRDAVCERVVGCVKGTPRLREYQLFWLGWLTERSLLQSRDAHRALYSLLEHPNATPLTRAKILEISYPRHGFPETQVDKLRSGPGWESWAAAVGMRDAPRAQRNHLMQYFKTSSPVSRCIAKCVEGS